MSHTRKCPDCTSPLQAFSPPAALGAQVELERCTRCAGVWCEWGRLQPVLGKAVEAELTGGATHRQCVLCRILLTPARLPGGQSIEVCSACRGLFLDAGELEQLVPRERRAPAAARAQATPPRPAPARKEAAKVEVTPFEQPGTFACVRCGERAPLREGQLLGGGLACRTCMSARGSGELNLGEMLFGRKK